MSDRNIYSTRKENASVFLRARHSHIRARGTEQHDGAGIEAVRTGLVDDAVVDIVPRRRHRAKDGGAGARPPRAALEGLGPADVRADGVEEVVAAGAAPGVAAAGDQHAREDAGYVLETDEEAALGAAVRRGKR